MFRRKKEEFPLKKKKHLKKWLVLAGIANLAFFLSKKKNRDGLVREYQEFTEDVKQQNWFKDWFVPHVGNDHKPKILSSYSVKALTAGLLITKIVLVSLLFAVYPGGVYLSPAVENDMVSLTNEYRQSVGAGPLVRNEYLDQVARVRAQDMIDRDYFSHYSPEGLKPWEWIDQGQYDFVRFGENLAVDFVTAGAVLKAFQASPTHDKNVVNPKYEEIGVAMVSGELDGRDTNLMVVFYGTQKDVMIVQAEPEEVIPQPAPVVEVPVEETIEQPVDEPVEQPIDETPVEEPVEPIEVPTPGQIILDGQLAQGDTTVAGLEREIIAPVSDTPIQVQGSTNFFQRLTLWSNNFYLMLLLAFVVIALLNIMISVKIQHRSSIVASFFMIAVAGYLWLADWHYYEAITGVVTILGFNV